jgi:hypothetical protein
VITIFEAALLSPGDSDSVAPARLVLEPTDSNAFVVRVLDLSGRQLGVYPHPSLEEATRWAERVYGPLSGFAPVTVERNPYPAPGAFPRPPRGSYRCPVCSATSLTEPAYDYFGLPSYSICPDCGTEFGFDDAYAFRPETASWASADSAARKSPRGSELERAFALARHFRGSQTRAATELRPDRVRYIFLESGLRNGATAFFFDSRGKRLGQECFPSREDALSVLSDRFELDGQGWRSVPHDAPLP